MDLQVQSQSGDQNKNGIALTSMIIGIASMVIGIVLVFLGPIGSVIGLIISVVGIVLGRKSRDAQNKGFAITGIITSSISGVIHLLVLLGMLIFGAAVSMLFGSLF